MAKCDACGKTENMPYQCRHCGGTYCGDHRLPENHSCPGLENWNDPKAVFDSGFDDSVNTGGRANASTSERIARKLDIDTGPGSFFGYFRGNMSYTFLGIMWIFFLLEIVVLYVLQAPGLFDTLFVLSQRNILYVYPWVTSVFSHAPNGLFHIAGNSIVLYFFGPVLERQIGSKKFAALFIVTGAVAGVAQVGTGMLLGTGGAGVLGASGAIMGILGVLTILAPNLKVYLWFLLPVPLWVLTFGFAALDLFGFLTPTSIMGGNVAHAAHLSGLVIGLVYGQRVKDKLRRPSQIQLGAGRGPGGPGGPGRGRGPF